MIVTKKIADLKPVLMKGVKGEIKEPYSLIKNSEQVIFVVTPGKNGSEFNKTLGYFSTYPGMQTFQCLYGSGVLIMQRNDQLDEAKEFKVVSLNANRPQVSVPASWGMCLVNSGNNFLVVLRNSLLDAKYKQVQPLLKKRGFVYYIVEKKGEIGFEPNPNYRLHPQITTE